MHVALLMLAFISDNTKNILQSYIFLQKIAATSIVNNTFKSMIIDTEFLTFVKTFRHAFFNKFQSLGVSFYESKYRKFYHSNP